MEGSPLILTKEKATHSPVASQTNGRLKSHERPDEPHKLNYNNHLLLLNDNKWFKLCSSST